MAPTEEALSPAQRVELYAAEHGESWVTQALRRLSDEQVERAFAALPRWRLACAESALEQRMRQEAAPTRPPRWETET